ncbi:alpha 1,3-fucosyltransferase, glycosyltransferase family 10 protein [Rhodotorula toruloides]|uniref:Fucosyltransferase n=1 Tax=Rhodotorula toruloides TaxID=5286 RepID=A0A511KKV4_RHOTO|nr:alpha 1,3-fucosyltransferase, glycosyltransferase family 10 protein [Rhodotorula toruloides]
MADSQRYPESTEDEAAVTEHLLAEDDQVPRDYRQPLARQVASNLFASPDRVADARRYLQGLPKPRIFAAAAVIVLLASLYTLSSQSFASRSARPAPSREAVEYWKSELDADVAAQAALAQRQAERVDQRQLVLSRAESEGLRRNDRSRGSGTPIILDWPAPPYFWAEHYGKGEGERIDVEGCAVECRLISGPLNETKRADAHVLIEYNTWRGHIEGLPKDGPRTLAPHQRAALHSLEPNSARLARTDELKLFDIFSHFSAYADVRFETYPRLLCDGPPSDKCDGLAELEEAAVADRWFGKERNRSPFFDEELARQAPLPADGVRLATFISNCGGGTRNRLIAELTKEGIIFDHYGKCKEDVFGGEKQNYSSIVTELVPGHGWPAKMKILALYDFVLVAENTVLSDYISEKTTQGLLAGGVPIVLGAPNLIDEVQGNSRDPVFIDATQYSPAELADMLKELAAQPDLRAPYRSWVKQLPHHPIVEYARRAREHDFTTRNMMTPMCSLCEHYHQFYDWSGESPLLSSSPIE